jgi:lycopene cyclase CruA
VTLRQRFPRTFETLSALPDGEATLENIAALEEGFARARAPGRGTIAIDRKGGPASGTAVDCDVVLAGGGLSLFYGAYLSRAGLRVVIFDRREIGRGHREWNISRRELAPLTASGLFTDEDVARLVLTEYRHGIVRWHGGGTYPVRGVLDCVVDAEALLPALRARATAAGARLLDRHALVGYAVGAGGVRVTLRGPDGATVEVIGRLFVDGLGAASPHARFDLACPTVGGVLRGLDEGEGALEVDPTVGEILVTTEGIEEGRQHIWEGFPSTGGRFTTYLFYYDEPSRLGAHPLFSLYERFFLTRGRYKRGAAEVEVEKATYGFIPAYTRLREMPVAPSDRVVLVGDAAGRHSPLTFCGFGSMIRSFVPVGDRIRACLASDRLAERDLARVWHEPPSLGVMGGLTLMMCSERHRTAARDPSSVNALLDAAFGVLAARGNDTFAAFVRDEIGFRDFFAFMNQTARIRPSIYDEVFAQLTPGEIARWLLRLGRLGAAQWRTVVR